MKRISARLGVLALMLLVALGFTSGCNILAPIYFATILVGMDPRIPPRFDFPEPEKDEPVVKIAVITESDAHTQMELGSIDRELNEAIARRLAEGLFTEKKKHVEVIKASKVHRWQDEHPDWRSITSEAEMGRRLGAAYVVYLELGNFSFYDQGSNKTLLQGKAELAVTVIKVDDDDGEVVLQREYVMVDFPKDRPIPVSGDMTPAKFRRLFLARIAERVCWTFLPHDSSEEYAKDPF
jgi:hypothetical protein